MPFDGFLGPRLIYYSREFLWTSGYLVGVEIGRLQPFWLACKTPIYLDESWRYLDGLNDQMIMQGFANVYHKHHRSLQLRPAGYGGQGLWLLSIIQIRKHAVDQGRATEARLQEACLNILEAS